MLPRSYVKDINKKVNSRKETTNEELTSKQKNIKKAQ